MESRRPGKAGARVLSQQVSTLLALLTGGVVGFLIHIWWGTLYYSHRRESSSCFFLYMFPGPWMAFGIPRGLDIVLELILNVLLV